MFSTIPPFVGFLVMALLPNEPQYKWTKWGGYFMVRFEELYISLLDMSWESDTHETAPKHFIYRTERAFTDSLC